MDPQPERIVAAASRRTDGSTDPHRQPTELQLAAADRASMYTLVYALAYAASTGSYHLQAALTGGWAAHWEAQRGVTIVAAVFIALALAVGVALRVLDLTPLTRVTLGQGWMVLGCFGIAYPGWLQVLDSGAVTFDTAINTLWVCVVLVSYPVMVSDDPRRTLVAVALGVASVPAALWLAGAFTGRPVTSAQWVDAVDVLIPVVLCGVIAVFGNRLVIGLGHEVYRAQRIGSYRLETLLGAGGMGEVWRAQHTLLARPAAIKLIRGENLTAGSAADAEHAVARFSREAEVTATLRSPHTVELYDFGTTAQGAFYIVMELLEGTDLQRMVDRFGPLPAERVVHLLLQACDSLGEAHERGMIHRDIKPANLYLCRLGRRLDWVKVLDFGIVKRRDRPQEASLTVDGSVTGTPAYMAPEVALGDAVDHRADLYALGCVAYWLLTGAAVFERDTAMKVVLAHANDTPVPPSQRTELDVPADVEAVVMACLEKDPSRRPASADQLAEQLAACACAERWTPDRARVWWDRHLPP